MFSPLSEFHVTNYMYIIIYKEPEFSFTYLNSCKVISSSKALGVSSSLKIVADCQL